VKDVSISIGGVVLFINKTLTSIPQVFHRAATDDNPLLYDIFVSTAAILFLGTPHRGSDKAGLGEVVRRIISASGFDTSDHHLKALQINSPELERIHEAFVKLYDRRERHFKVLTFQEAKGVIGTSYMKMNERVSSSANCH